MAINSMEEAVKAVQTGYNDAVEKKDNSLQERFLNLASELGSTAWMTYSSEADIKPVVDHMEGEVKISFLSALDTVICAPNNEDSMIAAALRPYTGQALKEALQAAHP